MFTWHFSSLLWYEYSIKGSWVFISKWFSLERERERGASQLAFWRCKLPAILLIEFIKAIHWFSVDRTSTSHFLCPGLTVPSEKWDEKGRDGVGCVFTRCCHEYKSRGDLVAKFPLWDFQRAKPQELRRVNILPSKRTFEKDFHDT